MIFRNRLPRVLRTFRDAYIYSDKCSELLVPPLNELSISHYYNDNETHVPRFFSLLQTTGDREKSATPTKSPAAVPSPRSTAVRDYNSNNHHQRHSLPRAKLLHSRHLSRSKPTIRPRARINNLLYTYRS